MYKLFEQKNKHHYNLRHHLEFTIPVVNSIYHGTECISFLGPKIEKILPDTLKGINRLAFKSAKICWEPEKSPSKLCRVYTLTMSILSTKT